LEVLEEEREAEAESAQGVLSPEDFIAANEEAERRAIELACRLSEVEAKAAR
jgi:hypothetical protein